MRGLLRRSTVLLTAALLAVISLAAGAAASPADESDFVARINQSRSAAGLAPLSVRSDLVAYARQHTDAMIASGNIFHSTSAQLSGATTGWSLLGENVGMGPNPSVLHTAFMQSPSHKANILGPFHHVGVGAKRAPDGTLFVTVIFMQVPEATVTTTTTTAPPTTTTTVPPTTTTTAAPRTEAAATGSSLPTTTTTTTAPASPASSPTAPASARPLGLGRLDQSPTRTLGFEMFFSALEEQQFCVVRKADGAICIE